jgi:hypothetical protein
MKKLAVIIASLFIPVASAQTSTTPNIVTNGYTNGYNTSSLNCWQSGDAYCSPNGQPYVNTGSGNINFSYGMWDIYQIRNVADVLPSGGTGLVVTGYHFQYTAKVGNHWDDASYDYLKSYVRIYGQGGQLIQSGNFTHTNTHDWYTFHLADNYNPLLTRFTKDNYTQVRFGFIGQDYNGWVGPYGPEITNVSFTLNYQPDPCLRSQLISPQCPGFLDAIQRVGSVPKQAEPAVESTTASIVTPTSSEVKKIETTAQTVARARQRDEVKLIQAGPEQATETASTESKTTSEVATVTMAEQTRSTQQTRTQTRTASQTQADVSVAVDNQQMDQSAGSGIKQTQEQSTMPTRTQTRTASQTQAEVSVAVDNQQMDQPAGSGTRQVQEQATIPTSTQTASTNTTTTASVDTGSSVVLPNPTPSQQAEPEPISVQVATIKLPEVPSQAQIQVDIPQPPQMEQVRPQVDLALVQPSTLYTPPQPVQVQPTTSVENVQVIEQPVLAKVDVQAQEAATSLPSNTLTDKTNPINDIVTAQPQMASMPTFSGPTVNQKAQDNDAAGGISIAQMARIPVGFEAYNIALKDVAFYAPKEIYRNQRNVDNTRALRQLGTDRLHQEMVDQQYRR